MLIKKLFLSVLILICLSSWVLPQSLVELSKKEKERRAKIAQKKTTVITNVDLIKKKINPALGSLTNEKNVVAPAESEENEESEVSESEENEEENTDQIDEEAVAKLEESWNMLEEFVSLLTLKIKALLQEFYSTDDLKLKEDIQRQMNEISQQLDSAKKDTEKAKEKYDLAKAALEKKKRI